MVSPKTTQNIAFFLLMTAALMVILPVAMVLAIIVKNGIGAISWSFLSEMPRSGMREGGILPAIIGTFYLVLGAVLFALPLGLCAAIYLSEYAKDNLLNRVVRLAIINLAGVPSVVFGLFGLALFVGFLRFGASILSGSLTLGLMILPVATFVAGVWLWRAAARAGGGKDWQPFAAAVAIFTLAFAGLAYSIFPYVVVDRLTIWEAATHPSALKVILIGAAIVLPFIVGYTILSYRIFRGKATKKLYD